MLYSLYKGEHKSIILAELLSDYLEIDWYYSENHLSQIASYIEKDLKLLKSKEAVTEAKFSLEKEIEEFTNNNLALRFNENKLQWHLVDFKSLEPLVKVLQYGVKKYTNETVSGKNNWKKGMYVTSILDSLQRHLNSFRDGNNIDSESGESELGHILTNTMFLIYMLREKPEMDDRNK